MNAPEGVLITGVYGTGKTSVCEEIAELLESAGRSYGAIDLDWLWWFHVPGLGERPRDRIGVANLSAVVASYLSVGVERFVLAGTVESIDDLDALRSALPFPLRVVQLTLAYEEIAVRLSPAVTSGRWNDLQEARRQSEQLPTVGELVVSNDRPIREVADQILEWLGWR